MDAKMMQLIVSALLLCDVALASHFAIQSYAAPAILPYPYTAFRSYPAALVQQQIADRALVQDARFNGGFAYSTQEFHGPLSPYIQSLHRYTAPTFSSFGYLQPQQAIIIPQPIYKPVAETFPSFFPPTSSQQGQTNDQQIPNNTPMQPQFPTSQPQFPPYQPQIPQEQPQFPAQPQIPPLQSQFPIPTQPPQQFPQQPTESPQTFPSEQPTQQPFGDSFQPGNNGDKGLNDEDTISVESA